MKLKEINMELSKFDLDFEHPKAHLEQYPTPVGLASSCLFEVDNTFDELSDKRVADFGCGTGVFALGAKLLGASEVTAFDIDEDSIEQAKENASEFFEMYDDEEGYIEFVLADVLNIDRLLAPSKGDLPIFDTILMNPPFGTVTANNGNDMAFVKKALVLVGSSGSVFSLHKSACRPFIMKECASCAVEAKVVAELAFPIKKMYKFHKKNSVDIAVDFIRFKNKSSIVAL